MVKTPGALVVTTLTRMELVFQQRCSEEHQNSNTTTYSMCSVVSTLNQHDSMLSYLVSGIRQEESLFQA